MSKDGNVTTTTEKRVYCAKFGQDRTKFIADFKAKRLALERAITIYMSEGPFSTTSFELSAGKKVRSVLENSETINKQLSSNFLRKSSEVDNIYTKLIRN